MTDELQALLPCPFCNGHAQWVEDPEVVNVPYGLVVKHAADCLMAGNVPFDRAHITAAWNRRTERPALIAERDALREALKEIEGGAKLASGMSVSDGPVFGAIREVARAALVQP